MRALRLLPAAALACAALLLGARPAAALVPGAGCDGAHTYKVGSGQTYTTIGAAIAGISPKSLSAAVCVEITDAATYNEQVDVRGFTNNGSSITIYTSSVFPPTVSPPSGSTAAFVIANASITVAGINIVVANSIPYAIYASSSYVGVSNVSISTSGSNAVYTAGVQLDSWSKLEYSTVSTPGADALVMTGVVGSSIAWSSFYSDSFRTIQVVDSSSNSFTGVYSSATNSSSGNALFFSACSNNVIDRSTFTIPGDVAVYITASTGNVMANSYVAAGIGTGAWIIGSDGNRILKSTFSTTGGPNTALYFLNSSSNAVIQAQVLAGNVGLEIDNGGNNLVDGSTVTASGVALTMSNASSCTITRSIIGSLGATGAQLTSNTGNVLISFSSITTTAAAYDALDLDNASSNVVTGCYIGAPSGGALQFMNAASNNTVMVSTAANNTISYNSMVVGSSSNTITRSLIENASGPGAFLWAAGSRTTISFSTVTANNANPALYINGASSTTVTGSVVSNAGGDGLKVDNSASYTMISSDTISATGGFAAYYAGAAWNSMVGTQLQGGVQQALFLNVGADNNLFMTSTMTAAGAGEAVYTTANSSTFSYCFASNTNGQGFNLGGSFNAVIRSTGIGGGAGGSGIYISATASSNTISQSYAYSPTFYGLELNGAGGANANWITYSTFTTGSALGGGGIFGASSNTLVGDVFSAPNGYGLILTNANANQVLLSTMTSGSASSPALSINTSLGNTVSGSYVVGASSGVVISGSTATVVSGNRFVLATAGVGAAVAASSGGNLLVAQNVTYPSPGGGGAIGVNLGPLNKGALVVATNTFAGAGVGVYVATQASLGVVWISSNTILPILPGPASGAGIFVNGPIPGGATIENNSIYFRKGGGASPNVYRGIYAQTASGLTIDHNRINNPSMLVGGTFVGIGLANVVNSTIKFNDVFGASSVNGPLTDANLLRLELGSSNVSERDNVWVSSFSGVTGSSALLWLDAASRIGFSANYNLYFSSPVGTSMASCNGAAVTLGQYWQCGVTQDTNSITVNPLWYGNDPGFEDFHPKSAKGRWNGVSFAVDAATSPTIDAADPSEPYANEALPNGSQANLGSYGNTAEASLTPPALCAVTRKVCKSGACSYSSIQDAINSLPNPLIGYSCVLVEDNAAYNETLTIANFTMAGSSMAVMLDPALSLRASIRPNVVAGSAVVTIQNSSVTFAGLDVTPNVGGFLYGVWSTSPTVTISSVNVVDPTGFLSTAGMALSSYTALSYSTITVMSSNGLYLDGAGNSVSVASVAALGAVGAGRAGIYLNGASGATLSNVYVGMSNTGSALMMSGAGSHQVNVATFTTNSGPNAVSLTGSASNGFTQTYAYAGVGSAILLTGSAANTITLSSATSFDSNAYAVVLGGGGNSLTRSVVTGAGSAASGGGLQFNSGSNNAVSSATISAAAGRAVYAVADNNASVSYSTVSSAGGDGVLFEGSNGDALSYSTVSVQGSGSAFHGNGAMNSAVAGCSLYAANGWAMRLTGSDKIQVSSSTLITQTGNQAVWVVGSSSGAYANDSIRNVNGSQGVVFDPTSHDNVVSGSTITGGSLAYGIDFYGGYFNRVSGTVISSGVLFDNGAWNNMITQSTMTGTSGVAAAYFQNAFANSITQSYLYNAAGSVAYFQGAGLNGGNSISQSTLFSPTPGSPALFLTASATNTFSNDFITTVGGTAVYFFNSSSSNTITQSTITGGGFASALLFEGSSSNTVSQSYIGNANQGSAALLQSGERGDLFQSDTLVAGPLRDGLLINGASRNTFFQDFITSGSTAVRVQSGDMNTIAASTMVSTGGNVGIYELSSSSLTVSGSYVQGSTGAYIYGSTWTFIGGSQLVATQAGAAALDWASQSMGLTVSSTVVRGGAMGAGLMLEPGNSGPAPVIISSNVFPAGPEGAVAAIQLPAPLYITSNTISVSVSASTHTYGLYLSQLSNGATVQNNSIFFRTPGSMGSFTGYGVFASNSSNVFIDHNRINNPGMIAAGGFVGVALVNTPAAFKYNDVAASGNALAPATLLQVAGSPGAVIRDNVFYNALTNGAGSYGVTVDAVSGPALSLDYNDYFTAGNTNLSYIGSWSGGRWNTLALWQANTGRDARSLLADPLFPSLAAGAEDFHLKSAAANGRFNPATQAFSVQDSSSSPAIDLADPAETFTGEPSPNGLRANAGSYGGTSEASKTTPPPGCDIQYTVASGGGADYFTIGQAIAQAPGIGAALTSNPCIVITQGGVHSEEVDISGIAPNGHHLTIMGHPNLNPHPIVDPAGGVAAFVIENDSITIQNIDVKPTGFPASYGILATSASIVISNVNIDAGNSISIAGLVISSRAYVVNSSVTVQNQIALYAVGQNSIVTQSSFTNVSNAQPTAQLAAVSGSTITLSYFMNAGVPSGFDAIELSSGSRENVIGFSTAATLGPGTALSVAGSSYNAVFQSYLISNSGVGLGIDAGSQGNSVSASTMTSFGAGSAGASVAGSSNSIVSALLLAQNGTALKISGSYNAVWSSTMATLAMIGASTNTIGSSVLFSPTTPLAISGGWGNVFTRDEIGTNGALTAAMTVSGSGGNLISQTDINALNGIALFLNAGANWNTVSQASVTVSGQAAAAIDVANSSSNTITGSFVWNGLGAGVRLLSLGHDTSISFSTITGITGVEVGYSSGVTISNDYVEGSTAVWVHGSSGTVVGASVLVATSPYGMGLSMAASNGLRASSNTIYGGWARAGLYLDTYNSGLIVVSTNSFMSSEDVGLFSSSQAPGTALWITSNTFAMGAGPIGGFGLWLNGLTTGATIQNNSFYVRAGGTLGGNQMAALYVASSGGIVVDHNRISSPGIVSGGKWYGGLFANTTPLVFKFNDVNTRTAASMIDAIALSLQASPGATIRDNVFVSSLTVTGSSATISIDGASLPGAQIDYNAYVSSTPMSLIAGNVIYTSASWNNGAFDVHGVFGRDPYWVSTAAGAEDFHMRSQDVGHCMNPPACDSWMPDTWTSALIDAADPAEPFALEMTPNGSRANLGSYGGTVEASRSPAPPGGQTIASVYASSIAVSYAGVGANGYGVIASTSLGFSPVVSSASAAALTLAPQGLLPNTTYFLASEALWGDYVAASFPALSTITLCVPPAPSAAPFTAPLGQPVVLQWLNGGNPVNVTTYSVVLTTDAFYPNADPGNVYFTTAPAGATLSAATSALSPNTTYTLFVAAVNFAGVPSSYVKMASSATLPADPGNLPQNFQTVSAATMTMAWNPNGNPLGITTYTVVASTASDFNAGASSVTLSTAPEAGPVATFGGLRANTTYYVKIAAVGFGGLTSNYVSLGSTITAIETPTTVVFDDISTTSIVASAYAPVLSSLSVGQSATRQAINGAYQAWHGEQWQKVLPNAPAGLYGAGVAAAGGSVYLVGGNNGTSVQSSLYRYSFTGGSWVGMTAMPAARQTQTATDGSRIFAVGGFEGSASTDVVTAYDPAADAWSYLNPMPTLRQTYGLAVDGSRLYAVGGDKAGTAQAVNEVYDMSADSWTSRQAMTTQRRGPAAGFVNGALYVVGGEGASIIGTTERYDPAADAWTARTAMPTARTRAASAVLGGKLFIMGGSRDNVTATAVTEDYDPATDSWTARAPMFQSVDRAQAAEWAGRIYVAAGATDPGQTSWFQTYDPGLATAFTGLSPNTQYSFKAQARNSLGTPTGETAVVSTYTLAATPASVVSTFTGVASSSIAVAWSANGNPAGTAYVVQLSTASDFNAWASSVSFSTTPANAPPLGATLSGLSPFTTYYFRVQAVNALGRTTPFLVLGSTVTLPPTLFAPVVQAATGFSTTTLTATWGLVTGATGYTLAASTMPGNPPNPIWASSAPAGVGATTATVAGLQPDTTYFLFVQADAVNAASFWSAFAATSTLPADPATALTTFSAVAQTGFTASWSNNGNPLGIATYTVVASTAADFNAFASSVTASTVPAAGPQYSFTGLFGNTTYYFGVRTVGNGGAVSAFVALGSTTTLVAAPTAPGQPFVAVASDTLSVAWGSGGNQLALTTYTVVASTASDFNAFASSVTLSTAPGAGPSATLSGLSANTTYYVRVQAVGLDGTPSGFAVLGSTSTRADAPAAAPFSAVGAGQIQANWTAGANPVGTLYDLVASSNAAFTGAVTSSFTYNLSVSSAGLAPNTTYFFKVAAVDNGGQATAFTALGSTATLANAPLAAASTFGMVGVTSFTVSWLANGNPLVVTTYTIVASTDSGFSQFASSVTLTTAPASGPSATMTGLQFGATYYVRVAAVNHDGISSAWTTVGSTLTVLSNLVPLIANNQAGDAQWRAANTGLYSVRFQDGSGTHLSKFQVATSTTPGQPGTFVDAVTNLSPADSFSTPWSLPASVFASMLEGTTNYVSVRVFNNVPDTSTVVDAFYVLKDTTAPSISGPVAGDAIVRSAAGTFYTIASTDTGGGLAAFQYSVSLVAGAGDASLVPWTNIATLNGAATYAAPWTVSFAALASGVTNYVSVRAWDLAGTTTTVKDAFYVLKDTVGPTVAISSPAATTGFVGAPGWVAGASSSPFALQGVEVAVYQAGLNLYWNPGSSAFNSGSPVWMPAAGTSAWSLDTGVPFADGVGYKIIARSSTTFNMYSTVYATASFVADLSTPTVGVQAPVPNSTVSSLPVISGTAADPGGSASGVSSVEVQLRRNSDGLWWNWFGETWTSVPVSTVPTGTSSWTLAPTPQLQANLATGASYFIAVRASDNALPPNQGNFFLQGATFTYSNPTPPAAISDLAAVPGPAPGDINLSWTATGENGSSGIVLLGQYRVFYSTDPATIPSTATAQVAFSTANVAPGGAQGCTITGLNAGGTYYLAIALENSDGNWSAFSNQASTVATPAPFDAIEGHVVNSSTQGITAVEIDAWNAAGTLVGTAFTLADGSGTYVVSGLTAGTYKLRASWTVNGITSSVTQDNISMGTVGVDFSLEINYALATLTGSLGTLAVRGGGAGPAAAGPAGSVSYVELYQNGRRVAKVNVPASGRWSIPGLLPGAYSVRAYTGVNYTDFVNVIVLEGQTQNVGLLFDPLSEDGVFAFPNPAKDQTTIRFQTALAAPRAEIGIFDLAGRLVRRMTTDDLIQPAPPSSGPGVYHAAWDLTNSRGQAVASGVYLVVVRVKAGAGGDVFKAVKKLAVVR